MTKHDFPEDFVWGVATSSFQIEGAIAEDGRSPSIWDTFASKRGKVQGGDIGEPACDHYHRWRSDLDLIAELGVDAYRFSVAWPRILPEGYGKVNTAGLDFYDALVDGMLARGLRPFCTLYHWDLPQVLDDKGGWLSRDISDIFCEFAEVVTQRLGDRVESYATLNEPWCASLLSYHLGHHAPGHQSLPEGLLAAHNLLLAHGKAVPIMRTNAPHAQHGIVLNVTPATPYREDNDNDLHAAKLFEGYFHDWFFSALFKGEYPQHMLEVYGNAAPEVESGDMDIISSTLDFIGINYYTSETVKHDRLGPMGVRPMKRPKVERTDMDWEVCPQGLRDILVGLDSRYDLPPIYITENGAAYPDTLAQGMVNDTDRISYFERHLAAVNEAREAGADVRGYFAWSLMDNFEWAFGYSKRFGLIYVDYDTQDRIWKESAKWYKAFLTPS